jgi:WD40 repeat protein
MDSVYSVAFAPNGRDLVSGSLDKTIKMWELASPPRIGVAQAPRGGKCIRTFEGHKVSNFSLHDTGLEAIADQIFAGLCPQRRTHSRWTLGTQRLER